MGSGRGQGNEGVLSFKGGRGLEKGGAWEAGGQWDGAWCGGGAYGVGGAREKGWGLGDLRDYWVGPLG